MIRGIAGTLGISYEEIMAGAEAWNADPKGWNYVVQQDETSWQRDFPGHAQSFWAAWEVVTGRTHGDHSDSFFSCSC